MILCITNVLSATELDLITQKLHGAEFVDGKTTAGWHARLVKHNSQLPGNSPVLKELRGTVNAALKRNALFEMAVRPRVIRPFLFSRYAAGMAYDRHVDNAVMGEQDMMRSDVSATLFLNSPLEYDGGELVIESTQGEQAYKLEAGSMIVYPSTTLHRVEPVKQGVRLAAVTWIQSLVRDPGDREILFDLDTARRAIFEQYGKTPEFDLISKSHANLLRRWVEV